MNERVRPDGMTLGYEALRAQATGDLPAVTPRGLTLFLAAGSPAWMKAWAPLTPATPAPRADREVRIGLGGEVVQLLTEMALGCRRRWATA